MNSKKLEELRAQAEKGLAPYQIELGHSLLTGVDYDGNVFPQDFSEAKHWLERAHEKGAFTATVILGTMYEEGKGTPVNIQKAIELYEFAVGRGAYLPCVYLARIYAQGKGVPQSLQQAVKWYQKVLSFEGQVDDEGEMEEAREFLRSNKQ
jgi:TPR repeat protein